MILGSRLNGEPVLLTQYCDYVYLTMQALPGPDLAAGGRHGLESSRRHSEIRSCSSVVARAAYASISPRGRRRASESEAGPMYRLIFLAPPPRPWKPQKDREPVPRIS